MRLPSIAAAANPEPALPLDAAIDNKTKPLGRQPRRTGTAGMLAGIPVADCVGAGTGLSPQGVLRNSA